MKILFDIYLRNCYKFDGNLGQCVSTYPAYVSLKYKTVNSIHDSVEHAANERGSFWIKCRSKCLAWFHFIEGKWMKCRLKAFHFSIASRKLTFLNIWDSLKCDFTKSHSWPIYSAAMNKLTDKNELNVLWCKTSFTFYFKFNKENVQQYIDINQLYMWVRAECEDLHFYKGLIIV